MIDILTEQEIEAIHDKAVIAVPPMGYDTGKWDWSWKKMFAQLAAQKGYEKASEELTKCVKCCERKSIYGGYFIAIFRDKAERSWG